MAQQITITLDLTPENLEILKLLCTASSITAGGSTPESGPSSSSNTESGKDKKAAKKSAAKDKKKAAPKEIPAEPENKAPTISLTDVRAVALKLSKAGKQKQLKEIFAKYGAEKLSDVAAEYYSDLLVDLEEANG